MKLFSSLLFAIGLSLVTAIGFQFCIRGIAPTVLQETTTQQETTSQEAGDQDTEQESAQDDEQEMPQTQTDETLQVDYPIEMDYLLYLPEDYDGDADEKWPLMLFLHGAGERGDDLGRVKVHGPPKLIEAGKSFPFIVVSPQCAAGSWWEPVSLTALLDEIEANYNVDPNRIYVTGLSMGGFGTWSLATHTPERFAAIVPICGGGDRFVSPRRIGDQMGVRIFHGAKDNVIPLERSQEVVDGFAGMGIEVDLTVYPEAGHDSWTETYDNDELYEWLMTNSRE